MTQSLVPLGPGVEVSPTGLSVTDTQMTFEAFESVIHGVAVIGDSARWWLGDLLLFGEARYGERYAQALEAARVSERQLNRYRYVCERVARSRRRENLPFSYHEEVAPLDPPDQARILVRAERDGWSRAELREAIADLRVVSSAAAGGSAQIGRGPTAGHVVAASTVDAARGVQSIRSTLEKVGSAIDTSEGREAVGLPEALRGADDLGRLVRRVSDLEDALTAYQTAVSGLLAASTEQRGLADPAVIVRSAAWKEAQRIHMIFGTKGGAE